jgi:hypothetical protein
MSNRCVRYHGASLPRETTSCPSSDGRDPSGGSLLDRLLVRGDTYLAGPEFRGGSLALLTNSLSARYIFITHYSELSSRTRLYSTSAYPPPSLTHIIFLHISSFVDQCFGRSCTQYIITWAPPRARSWDGAALFAKPQSEFHGTEHRLDKLK